MNSLPTTEDLASTLAEARRLASDLLAREQQWQRELCGIVADDPLRERTSVGPAAILQCVAQGCDSFDLDGAVD